MCRGSVAKSEEPKQAGVAGRQNGGRSTVGDETVTGHLVQLQPTGVTLTSEAKLHRRL